MPQRDCPIILNGCPGVDAPITNISAEAADTFQWAAQIWSPWDPYRPPRLGDGQQVKVDCSALASDVFSNFNPIVFSESQAMANIIALGQSLGCPWNIPEISGILLQNDAQSATVTCPDGSSFTVEIPAGTYQIDAAILCGYPTDTVTFVKSGSANVVVTHPGCFVQFTQDELLGSQLNTATWLCIDGHTFTQSVSGYMSSAAIACEAWLQQANDWAIAEAQSQATALLDCVTKDDPVGPGDDPPTVFPGPSIFTNPTWTCLGDEFFSSYNIGGRGSSAYTLEIISGTIPPGLVFTQTNPRRATLSGTTTASGAYTFTIKATSTVLPFSVIQAVDTVFVFGLVSSSLPDATLGIPYSETLSADGGTAPYTFALDPDSVPLPDGLTLASDGTISGTPTVNGDYSFDVAITDANGGECVQTVSLAITGCAFSCLPEKSITLPALSSTSTCCTDEASGKVFAAQFIIGSAGTVNRLNASSTSIESSVVVDAVNGITDMVYHSGSGLIYISTSGGSSGTIYALDPSSMSVVGSAAHSMASVKLASDVENSRVYIVGQKYPPGPVFMLKSLDINTMAISNVASGDTSGSAVVAYIPSTSSIAQNTALIACGITGNQLNLYKASDFSLFSVMSLSNSITGMDGGFDPTTDGSLVFSYLSGGVYRIRSLEVTPGFGEFTTAPFNAPAIGNTIQIAIGTTVGLAPIQPFFISGVQWELVSIDSGTLITVRNLSVVFGTLFAIGTFVFGYGVFDASFYTPQAVPTSVSYSKTISAFVLAHTTQAFVIDRATKNLLCTFTPSVAASVRPTRCDVSGSCNVVLPWQTGGISDFYKVY